MKVSSLAIKQFRCFDSIKLRLDKFVVLIKGNNGTGKTSLLEALSYIFNARSFKTTGIQQAINISSDSCSIIGELEGSHGVDTITVLMAQQKKAIKLNQKPIKSIRELTKLVCSIALTEDDLDLIKGAPLVRRTFLDQAIALVDPDYGKLMRNYKQILDNRNALLYGFALKQIFNQEAYDLWSNQLLKSAKLIEAKRIEMLKSIEINTNKLALQVGYPFRIELKYESETSLESCETIADILDKKPDLIKKERQQKRSLFGAHLDDFAIYINSTNARIFASRGQQKFLLFLLKLAQADNVLDLLGQKPVLLLDDIMTDFDKEALHKILNLAINLSSQLIITSPTSDSILERFLLENISQDDLLILSLS